MLSLKRSYVDFMQAVGAFGPLEKLAEGARETDSYGWRRWLASLLAIYDTKRMVALDLPWWNVAATREIEDFIMLRPGARVFEYGPGASTAWLARRAKAVVSVEHDGDFIAKFRDMLAPFANVTLIERSIEDGPDGYVSAIVAAGGQFDLIVVDGRYRAACLKAAIPHLKADGIVLFDDSGRKRYRQAIEECGLVETHHFGRSFCVPYPDHTSLLTSRA